MSLLEQLWDDTVAGPRPETGLGKLRKQFRSNNSGKELKDGSVRSVACASEDAVQVTRSIMIMKPPTTQGDETGTPPASPAGSTTPVSPLSGGAFRFRRRSTSDAYEKASRVGAGSPRPPYDV